MGKTIVVIAIEAACYLGANLGDETDDRNIYRALLVTRTRHGAASAITLA